MFWHDSVMKYKLNPRIKSTRHYFRRNLHWFMIFGSIAFLSYSVYNASQWIPNVLSEPQRYDQYLPSIIDTANSAMIGIGLLGIGLFLWRKCLIALAPIPILLLGYSFLIKYASDNHIKDYSLLVRRNANTMLVLLFLIFPTFVLVVYLSNRLVKHKNPQESIWSTTAAELVNNRTPIPKTENPLVLRTDFSNQTVWDKICAEIRKPVSNYHFLANVEFLSDEKYLGITIEKLLAALPETYNHSFIIVVDQMAISQTDHPLLILKLGKEPGDEFRAIPSQIQGIENNLSIANMDFEEFALAVDEDGVFRDFKK